MERERERCVCEWSGGEAQVEVRYFIPLMYLSQKLSLKTVFVTEVFGNKVPCLVLCSPTARNVNQCVCVRERESEKERERCFVCPLVDYCPVM